MKQLLQNLRTGETLVAEVPIPAPQYGQALVRTSGSLVSSGTERMIVEFAEKSLLAKARSRPDLVRQMIDKTRREGVLSTAEAALNRLEQPMPLGYSSSGTIVALGDGITGFHVGQRVACAGGGYAVHAEYASVPVNLLAPLPDGVDYESAAFTTLGAIALHGFRLAEVQLGERVAVIGLGLLGLLSAGIANAAGCRVLGIDLNPERVDLAKKMGAEAVTRDQAEDSAGAFSKGIGCDGILICADTTSNDPVELAGTIARDRARVIAVGAVGLEIPRKVYFEKELTFLTSRSYGPGRYDPTYEESGHDYPVGYVRWTEGRNLKAFIDLLTTGRLNVKHLITHRFPIDQAAEAYELITGKKDEPFLGVLLTYPEAEQEDEEVDKGVRISTQEINQVKLTPAEADIKEVSVGVLGAGTFATSVMLPAMSKIPDIHLLGIASASGLSAQHAADRYGFSYADSDEVRIINDPDINTVAVLTRHNLHSRQVLSALRTGKHVFCEKPLAINETELNEIEQIMQGERDMGEEKNSRKTPIRHPLLTVGFNRRFAPLARRMKDFLTNCPEPLVAHYRVNAGYLPLDHWLHDPDQGGGRIIGEGCHFMDFLTFLVGESPTTVTAHALPECGRYREDNVVMTLSFPDGSLGTISYLANGDKSLPKERIEAFCAGRVAVLNDFRTLETISNGKRRTLRSWLRQDKGHRAEWEVFSNAILTAGPPPIPYKQLFSVTRATFAAVQSLRNREKVGIS
jgi:predicted dehydrogenase/threonine dehydrogenase-like Zn-dependent dehydrogenase